MNGTMMPQGRIGAGVVQHGAAQAEDLALRVDRDRDLPVLVALLRRREEMLAAVLLPFHRTAELHRRGRDHRLLGIERRLGAEAAADERRDHADRFEVALEQVGRACRGKDAASASTTRPSACRRPDRSSPARRGLPSVIAAPRCRRSLLLEHMRRVRRTRPRRRRSSSARRRRRWRRDRCARARRRASPRRGQSLTAGSGS